MTSAPEIESQTPENGVIIQVAETGSPSESASRLVWWLGRLAIRQMGRQPSPEIGDIVIEVTHFFTLARKQLGLISAVGELIATERDEERGTIYTIRTLEGKDQVWENAEIVTIEKADAREKLA